MQKLFGVHVNLGPQALSFWLRPSPPLSSALPSLPLLPSSSRCGLEVITEGHSHGPGSAGHADEG